MTTTERNVLGARTFDHTDLAALPEYHAFVEALDKLARADGAGMSIKKRFAVIADAERSRFYGDCCSQCQTMRFPIAATVEKNWLNGS